MLPDIDWNRRQFESRGECAGGGWEEMATRFHFCHIILQGAFKEAALQLGEISSAALTQMVKTTLFTLVVLC